MGWPSSRFAFRTLIVLASDFLFVPVLLAQMGMSQQQNTQASNPTDAMQTEMHMLTDIQTQGGVDPKQKAAYQAFFKEEDPVKKIQLGTAFLQKYPKSPFAEPVDVGMMNTFYMQQDWKDTYRVADDALALKPDDVDVLTTVGWTIPHFYNPNDPNAEQQLDKAETYSKHALDVLEKMTKPANLSDAQFAALKAKKSNQAHSALGLVYFRRENYEDSAKELQLATQGNASPDQTDLYVLGLDYQNLNRFDEAAKAFDNCVQIDGSLKDNCKQSADAARKSAGAKK